MNCLPIERLAAMICNEGTQINSALPSERIGMPCGGDDIGKLWLTIIFMLMSRLTLSMKTSLEDS